MSAAAASSDLAAPAPAAGYGGFKQPKMREADASWFAMASASEEVPQLAASSSSSSDCSAVTEIGHEVSLDLMIGAASSEEVSQLAVRAGIGEEAPQLAASSSSFYSAATESGQEITAEREDAPQLAASSSYYSAVTEMGQEVCLDQMIEAAASEEAQLAASASLDHSAATEMAKKASLDDLTLEAAASEKVPQLAGSTSSDHSAVTEIEIGQEVSLEQMIVAAASDEAITLEAAASEDVPRLAASSSSGSSSVTDNTQEEALDVTFVDEATVGAASLDGRWNVCTLDLPCGLDLELTIGGEPLPRDAEAKELKGLPTEALQEASPSSYGHPVSPLSFRLVPAVVTVGTAETRRSGDETEKVSWWERLQQFSSKAFDVFEAVETSTCDAIEWATTPACAAASNMKLPEAEDLPAISDCGCAPSEKPAEKVEEKKTEQVDKEKDVPW